MFEAGLPCLEHAKFSGHPKAALADKGTLQASIIKLILGVRQDLIQDLVI